MLYRILLSSLEVPGFPTSQLLLLPSAGGPGSLFPLAPHSRSTVTSQPGRTPCILSLCRSSPETLSSSRFRYATLCGALGYGSHLLSDALTHRYEYSMLWPISPQITSIGIFFPYIRTSSGLQRPAFLEHPSLF